MRGIGICGARLAVQMFGDAGGDMAGHHARQFFRRGEAHARDAAEAAKQLLHRARADAGDGVEFGGHGAAGAALAVKTDGEAMRFVADLLDQV